MAREVAGFRFLLNQPVLERKTVSFKMTCSGTLRLKVPVMAPLDAWMKSPLALTRTMAVMALALGAPQELSGPQVFKANIHNTLHILYV